jgi:peptidoglycan LD-endopeptidase CwlK
MSLLGNYGSEARQERSIMNSNLYPPFRDKVVQLMELIKKNNIPADIFSDYRSFSDQQVLYNKGRDANGNVIDKSKIVTNGKPGSSAHNYGLAVDIVFKVNSRWTWDPMNDWKTLGDLGKSVGLEWGGDWSGFPDRPHFQWKVKGGIEKYLPELKVILLKRKKLSDVWDRLKSIA